MFQSQTPSESNVLKSNNLKVILHGTIFNATSHIFRQFLMQKIVAAKCFMVLDGLIITCNTFTLPQ